MTGRTAPDVTPPSAPANACGSALETLPLEQRRALVLAALCGRTAREISEIEHAPLGTIKTRIRTAMLKMRSQLEVMEL